ncbi:right-handed parallel beta-helix repeat-containing protein [Gelidibacter salicanalis]|uniref:Right-handed parallel beta-helix repeat-containing protein n=1 Tax=Gelidibacter salicanalis TaxID=291193 RepID=A0A934NKN0_9FLAO|nr:right-handed parallel beta-helix repeat-containing protein [Gelidibacter salicanalis]MBJ7881447.1 right-handed parallel beta-helix repeat-containing protein [Gelidibacter salicanalis]
MKRSLYFSLTVITLILWSSCRKDFDFQPSQGGLTFSKDTVYLDTVFTNIGSSTYNLKVYNRTNTDISIPTLRLSQGQASNYRLNVDGIAGKEFQNVELLAKDSLYIFIETTFDIQSVVTAENQFLYTDAIEFDSGANFQKVDLVTLVKDAVFIYPNKDSEGIIETLNFDVDGDGSEDRTDIQGRFLTDAELTFTNDRPYVIYGYAAVGENKTLTINAGARVHFHSNSGLLITNNASLKVQGQYSPNQTTMANEVIFESDRLEPLYENIPGQWGTIWLFQGSKENEINFATIKNATIGIISENNPNTSIPKLTIKNSKVYNSSNYGILGRATSITAENVVFNNAGQSSFAGIYGGVYNFTHCTIANYWTNSFRQFPALYLNNFEVSEDDTITTNPLTAANFNNCIIYGNYNPEFFLEQEQGADFNFKFTNCLIKFDDPNNKFGADANYDFNNPALYDNVVFNEDPDFKEPLKNKLMIREESAAINVIGNNEFSNRVPFDILRVSRTAAPDLGAYQHIIFEE